MKKLFSFVAMLLAAAATYGQNALTAASTEIPQSGGDLQLVLTLAEENVYSSYQWKIETPDGLAYVTDEDDDVECTLGTGHDNSHGATAHWNASTRTLGFGVVSTKTALLSGTTVELSIPMAATTAEVGSELQLKFTGVTFIRATGVKDVLDDVTITVTIGEPDDGRIKFDENATKLPTYTAGDKADVTVKRTIKAGEWSTIVLPFTLTMAKAKAAFGDDVELAEFSGFEVDYGDDEDNVVPLGITMNFATYTMSAKKSMTGGKPFLIRTSKDIESFEADDVTLFGNVTDVSKSDEYDTSGKMTGTLVKSTIPADGLFISGNKFWYSTGKTNVKAFRCWFELGAVLDKETDFGARVYLNFVDDETTGIQDNNREIITDNRYFDLQGRRVVKPGKGLYVKNGKKTVNK